MFKNNFGFYLKMAILYLGEARYPYMFMNIIFIFSLVLFGMGILIQNNFKNFIEEKKSNYEVMVYLKKDYDKNKFFNALKEFHGLSKVTYINPEKFEASIKTEDKKMAKLISSLSFNPFPVAYSIILKKEVWSKDKVKDLVDFLAKKPEVEDVDFGETVIDFLTAIFVNIEKVTKYILYVLGMIGLFSMLGATINCRKYLTSSIGILKLSGAGKIFIRMPFILAGIIIGIISSIVALVLLASVFSYIAKDVPIIFLSWYDISIIFCAGCIIPILGNIFSLE
ncbi:hypothetical protein HY745_00100 [Candidatus Desantisbacteria bacterium]|nr:hypothetical protein [Candidatus Desantisbacteria bacterium]